MAESIPVSGVAFVPTLDRAALAAQADNPQAAGARDPELMAACQNFEAIFLSQLLRVMRQGESKDKLFGGGLAEGIYRELLDDQLAREMATSGSTGISRMLYDDLEPAVLAARARITDAHGMDAEPNPVMDADHDTRAGRTSP